MLIGDIQFNIVLKLKNNVKSYQLEYYKHKEFIYYL
ncbi:uncharacterized protein METZ01_LOCUS352030 [marine metagenome]|uniref:Uncharacterized protein n=1 Tax=marine metagenome TaxID=408172 RepID=A0A382RNF1_9ZZZZ